MKILELFGEVKQLEIKGWFPKGSEIESLPIRELIGQARKKEDYDIVVMAHSLQKLRGEDVIPLLAACFDVLKTRGEIWIYAPSFEWCAKQAFMQDPSPILLYQIYGTKDSPNLSVYTLAWIRQLTEAAGFTPRQATQSIYKMKMEGLDEEIPLLQNVVIGWKTHDRPITAAPSNPATAID